MMNAPPAENSLLRYLYWREAAWRVHFLQTKFPGGTMDKRRLLLGSAVLLVLAGLLLAALTPGGWFNSGTTQAVDTPIGSIRIQEKKSSNWPTLGYILLGVGGAGLVFVFAMKSPPRI
jgi:hypothetical protein